MRAKWLSILALLVVCSLCFSKEKQARSLKNEAIHNARKEFTRQYQDKCLKYPWLVDYIKELYRVRGFDPRASKPPLRRSKMTKHFHFWEKEVLSQPYPRPVNNGQRFAVSIFQANDAKIARKGIGDRFAGILSVFFWALRSGRTFLVQDEIGLISNLFRPVPLYVLNKSPNSAATYETTLTSSPKWGNWSWAGYDYGRHGFVNFTDCVDAEIHPKPTPCKFQYSDSWPDKDVVRISSNRCWLCSWLEDRTSEVYHDMQRLFFFDKHKSNLFEWAGCALRTVLWPTHLMWQRMDQYYDDILRKRDTLVQIGTHFRCGDNAFSSGYDRSACVVEKGKPWKGIRPVTDSTATTPIDLATCARGILEQSNRSRPIFMVASDSQDSAAQIASTAEWADTIIQPKGCHIADNETSTCGDITLDGWFSLTLSRALVVQSPSDSSQSSYPVSSFSRYALLYGLQLDSVKYGDRCAKKQMNSPVHRGLRNTQGNWRCG